MWPAVLIANQRQRRFYQRRWRRFGATFRTLAWNSRDAQVRRYEALAQVGDLTGATVLDLGCGLGDLFAFLAEHRIDCEAYGYDIVPEFVSHCRDRFPSVAVEERNILWSPPKRRFDYVFCCGVFALGNRAFFRRLLHAAWNLADTALAFNIYRPRTSRYFRSEQPDAMAATRLLPGVRRVRSTDQYVPNDYTVFAYR